ncbi:glucosaminidase domain-containing protein [Candidatus Saganbacteria bacterium]|nr:glucosaminidase domain-containing protein [Candidatus Saganbacteria bacterium]
MVKKIIIMCLILFYGFTLAGAEDARVMKLEKFLARFPWSPLRGHEHEIVYCADKFGIDYRLYVAIAGAESSFGKKFPKQAKNLTGHRNGVTRFSSIYHNIHATSKLVGTAKYYQKYRRTRNLWDFLYVYKGVPPYKHYYVNLRYTFDEVARVRIFTPPQLAKPAGNNVALISND